MADSHRRRRHLDEQAGEGHRRPLRPREADVPRRGQDGDGEVVAGHRPPPPPQEEPEQANVLGDLEGVSLPADVDAGRHVEQSKLVRRAAVPLLPAPRQVVGPARAARRPLRDVVVVVDVLQRPRR